MLKTNGALPFSGTKESKGDRVSTADSTLFLTLANGVLEFRLYIF